MRGRRTDGDQGRRSAHPHIAKGDNEASSGSKRRGQNHKIALRRLRLQISSKHVKPITLCKPGKGEPDPTIWEKYKSIVEKADGRSYEFAKLDHGKFLEAARAASVVVMTGEDTEHSSILLTKGRVDGLSSTAQLFSRSTTVPGNSTNQREATSTTPRPSRMKEEPEEPQEQSRVTAKKRSGRGNGEGNEDDDETTVNDLREALEALRNES